MVEAFRWRERNRCGDCFGGFRICVWRNQRRVRSERSVCRRSGGGVRERPALLLEATKVQVLDVSSVYPSNREEKQVESGLVWESSGWLMRTRRWRTR